MAVTDRHMGRDTVEDARKYAIDALGFYNFLNLSTNAEIWDMNSLQNQIINPAISDDYWQVGLFPVDPGFCSRN